MPPPPPSPLRLGEAVRLDATKLLPSGAADRVQWSAADPALVLLAAGRGTRFGVSPKCTQPVCGKALARHSLDAFREISAGPRICLVGYRHEEVCAALENDNLFVLSDNPVGGTAYATLEAFCCQQLLTNNPLVVVTMGDRIVPAGIFRRLLDTHQTGNREADLTFLTARYEPPKHQSKGRILRGEDGRVLGVIEQRDIDAIDDPTRRHALDAITEGNCPLLVMRATTLHRHLLAIGNDNAQQQYYLTDIVGAVAAEGGEIRTVTTTAADPEYDLLCSDVTRPMDLAILESAVAADEIVRPGISVLDAALRAVTEERPPVQIAAIARQLRLLLESIRTEQLAFDPDQPCAIGISGGRMRIAFMHPDMARFYGPAWQMPIGAGEADGEEQIVVLVQSAGDRHLHVFSTNPKFRETVNALPGDQEVMFPGEEIADLHSYETFGTRMSETLLLSLGYFSDSELAARRSAGLPLPPSSLWVANSMRRPFSLLGNAIASLRTLRGGHLGARVEAAIGRATFHGLRVLTTGNIPQGGFSSSSAVTLAAKNAVNALFDLGIPADLLVHLACQAEYGTGVRAGSLDQATEQKGRAGIGTLISSNPRDNYHVLGAYPVPADRMHLLFPNTVDRDREAWRWSGGVFGQTTGTGRPTTGEMRKLTGKAAEICAILLELPLETDFFKVIEPDLLDDGLLTAENRKWIAGVLQRVPLLVCRDALHALLEEKRAWFLQEWTRSGGLDPQAATRKVDGIFAALLAGWQDPVLRRTLPNGEIVEEQGVPLRSMLAYLFAEVARNFRLIHEPESWIHWVTLSQGGDRFFEIEPDALPSPAKLEQGLEWEKEFEGADLLDQWLERTGARPVDFQRGLDDASLAIDRPLDLETLPGGNFFRGLALIDFAEAILKRAFGPDAVAVRVNAAGQGDFFQVHIDKTRVAVDRVQQFLRLAFYRRFNLDPAPAFVVCHPGGGATGFRLNRLQDLAQLADQLKQAG